MILYWDGGTASVHANNDIETEQHVIVRVYGLSLPPPPPPSIPVQILMSVTPPTSTQPTAALTSVPTLRAATLAAAPQGSG